MDTVKSIKKKRKIDMTKEKLEFGNSQEPYRLPLQEEAQNDKLLPFFRRAFQKRTPEPLEETSQNEIAPLTHPQTAQATPINTIADDKRDTIVAKDTLLDGNLTSDGNVRILGEVKGELAAQGRVSVSGHVTGNISGKSIAFTGGLAEGDLVAKERVLINAKGMVIGNVICKDSEIDGKLKGNIQAEGTIALKRNAVVHGNITASNFSAEKGSVLNGQVTIICQKNETELFALPITEEKSEELPTECNLADDSGNQE